FYRRGPRRPPPKPPPGIGCAGEARARSGTLNAVLCDFRSVGHSWTWKCSTFERRLCRRNDFWGEGSEGGRSPPPSGTYREYASRAAVGRRLAAGPFSSLKTERFSDGLLAPLRGSWESRMARPGTLTDEEARRRLGALPGWALPG